MGFEVSKEAAIDLESIGQYTSEAWGKTQAAKYLYELEQKFIFLVENPLLNRERLEITPPIRIQPHAHHSIVYTQTADGVFIVRVLHKNMDIEAHLESEELKD